VCLNAVSWYGIIERFTELSFRNRIIGSFKRIAMFMTFLLLLLLLAKTKDFLLNASEMNGQTS